MLKIYSKQSLKVVVRNKGMEAWGKKGLKAQDIQQLSSFILSLQGTNPPNAKERRR